MINEIMNGPILQVDESANYDGRKRKVRISTGLCYNYD